MSATGPFIVTRRHDGGGEWRGSRGEYVHVASGVAVERTADGEAWRTTWVGSDRYDTAREARAAVEARWSEPSYCEAFATLAVARGEAWVRVCAAFAPEVFEDGQRSAHEEDLRRAARALVAGGTLSLPNGDVIEVHAPNLRFLSWPEAEGGYITSCQQWPGVVGSGDTEDEARLSWVAAWNAEHGIGSEAGGR